MYRHAWEHVFSFSSIGDIARVCGVSRVCHAAVRHMSVVPGRENQVSMSLYVLQILAQRRPRHGIGISGSAVARHVSSLRVGGCGCVPYQSESAPRLVLGFAARCFPSLRHFFVTTRQIRSTATITASEAAAYTPIIIQNALLASEKADEEKDGKFVFPVGLLDFETDVGDWSTSAELLHALGELKHLQSVHLSTSSHRAMYNLSPLGRVRSLQSLHVSGAFLNERLPSADVESIVMQLRAVGHIPTVYIYPDLHNMSILRCLSQMDEASASPFVSPLVDAVQWHTIENVVKSDAMVHCISRLRSVRALSLGWFVTCDLLRVCLSTMPQLECLELRFPWGGSLGSQVLKDCLPLTPHMHTLKFQDALPRDTAFLNLPSLRASLRELHFVFDHISPPLPLLLPSFSQLRALRCVRITASNVSYEVIVEHALSTLRAALPLVDFSCVTA